MTEDPHEGCLWTAYKHAAKDMWKNLEQPTDPTSCDRIVTDPIGSSLCRSIEVALLEQIKYVGSKFVKQDVPDNWDFLVYLEMLGKSQISGDTENKELKPYGFVQLSFFWNFKRWTIPEKEDGIVSAIRRLNFQRF
jgi:hypothetical protein|tara:strand:- start:9708 stop:10115 length:408 start_codon:yes stop_codon:yes gene_type:complete